MIDIGYLKKDAADCTFLFIICFYWNTFVWTLNHKQNYENIFENDEADNPWTLLPDVVNIMLSVCPVDVYIKMQKLAWPEYPCQQTSVTILE